jgi:hypothetical protein
MRIKNLGFVKFAKNRRAILVKRNEVDTVSLFVKPMYTNLMSIAKLSRRVSSLFYAACFLNAIFTRPVLLYLILTDEHFSYYEIRYPLSKLILFHELMLAKTFLPPLRSPPAHQIKMQPLLLHQTYKKKPLCAMHRG